MNGMNDSPSILRTVDDFEYLDDWMIYLFRL